MTALRMNNSAMGDALLDLLRRDAARKSRRKKLGKFVTALLTFVASRLLDGLWFMLAVGIAHHEWVPALPTIGYWWAVLVVWLVGASLARVVRAGTSKAEGA